MKTKKIVASFLLLFISALWGGSFVAQSKGGELVGPLTYGFLRFFVAGVAVLPLLKLIDRAAETQNSKPKNKKDLIVGGVLCGFFLAGTSAFQQLGLAMGTSSGKAGFLTACNVIFVPIISLFFKNKIKLNVWLGVVITVVGLYFLCLNGDMTVQLSDILVLICSVMNAARIVTVDRFMNKTDTAKLACIQFFSASLMLLLISLIFEADSLSVWFESFKQGALWLTLLYSGVLAGAVAFTVQIVAQKQINPTVSSILMSTESVFAVLAGVIIVHETLTVRELIGCATVFVALIVSQLSFNNKRKARV